jgi:hypothetical protein
MGFSDAEGGSRKLEVATEAGGVIVRGGEAADVFLSCLSSSAVRKVSGTRNVEGRFFLDNRSVALDLIRVLVAGEFRPPNF